nr:hypothetical protein CFP56_53652 [Quercus suber]
MRGSEDSKRTGLLRMTFPGTSPQYRESSYLDQGSGTSEAVRAVPVAVGREGSNAPSLEEGRIEQLGRMTKGTRAVIVLFPGPRL